MSEQWGPGGVEPPLTLESEQAVRTRAANKGGRVAAGVVGVVLLLGGTVFAVTQLGSSGPGSAEEAVRELLDAASNEDVLGLLASLDPGERDTLRGPAEDLFAELERLEVLAPGFDPSQIGGVDLAFDDVTLRSEPVRDDLVRVYFTGGTVTSSYTGTELPVGAFVTDTMERFGSEMPATAESETSDIVEDDDTFLVARNGPDGWRVSIGYTMAEAARLDAGVPLGAGIVADGAEGPSEAVDQMLHAMADLDLRRVIALLAPGEMGALQDYAGLFIDRAEAEIADATADFDVTIDDLELREDGNTVFVDAFGLTVTAEGETLTLSTDGKCFTASGDMVDELGDSPFADGPICGGNVGELYSDALDDAGFDSDPAVALPQFPPFETPEVGIVTVEVDGEHYVAPVATTLDAAVAVLGALERPHLDAFVEVVEGFFFVPFGFSTEFEEVGEPVEPGWAPYPSTTTLEGMDPNGFHDPRVLQEIAMLVAGDEAQASCIVEVLWSYDETVLFDLTDSWVNGSDPRPESQDALYGAVERCSP